MWITFTVPAFLPEAVLYGTETQPLTAFDSADDDGITHSY